jgi:hypothetical protein
VKGGNNDTCGHEAAANGGRAGCKRVTFSRFGTEIRSVLGGCIQNRIERYQAYIGRGSNTPLKCDPSIVLYGSNILLGKIICAWKKTSLYN